ATGLLRAQGRPVHLVFQGIERPSLEPDEVPTSAAEAIALARELELEDSCVHFHHDWVPYEERQSWLLDSDLGISAHSDHLEARFSFRTRVLDYLWAGLPVVTSSGDSIAELVEREGLGRTVAPGDAEAFACACAELLDDPEVRVDAREQPHVPLPQLLEDGDVVEEQPVGDESQVEHEAVGEQLADEAAVLIAEGSRQHDRDRDDDVERAALEELRVADHL